MSKPRARRLTEGNTEANDTQRVSAEIINYKNKAIEADTKRINVLSGI